MYPITHKRTLAEGIILMQVRAPRIAAAAQPGQFVILCATPTSERIPLTICDSNNDAGTITIVTQIAGAATRQLCALQEGDHIAHCAGPLGKPCEWLTLTQEELIAQNPIFIAGGLGAAPVFPQVKWLHQHGAPADVIIGAKRKDLLIFTQEMQAASRHLYLATDDGSEGFHGLVTDLFRSLMRTNTDKPYRLLIAIGPMIMMKFAALAAAEFALPAIASMNTLMVDGTGMCGACRVSVGGTMRFTCVDGPEFDAHAIDFDQAIRRQAMYRQQEKEADCKCRTIF